MHGTMLFAAAIGAVMLYVVRTANKTNLQLFGDLPVPVKRFHTQPVWYVFVGINIVIGLYCFCSATKLDGTDWKLFVGALSMLPIAIAVCATLRFMRSWVFLYHDRLVSITGKRKDEVDFSEVHRVWIGGGYIVIDTRGGQRKVVPIMFTDWRNLYNVLVEHATCNRPK